MVVAKIQKTRTETVTMPEGDITISFRERYGTMFYNVVGEKVLGGGQRAPEVLVQVLADSLVQVSGAQVEADGELLEVNSHLDVGRYNTLSGSKFTRWQDVFAEQFGHYLFALAVKLTPEIESLSGLGSKERARAEGNSGGTSPNSFDGAPTSAPSTPETVKTS